MATVKIDWTRKNVELVLDPPSTTVSTSEEFKEEIGWNIYDNNTGSAIFVSAEQIIEGSRVFVRDPDGRRWKLLDGFFEERVGERTMTTREVLDRFSITAKRVETYADLATVDKSGKIDGIIRIPCENNAIEKADVGAVYL